MSANTTPADLTIHPRDLKFNRTNAGSSSAAASHDTRWWLGNDPIRTAFLNALSITFPAGAQSTWHKHPGPVFIIVAEGTMRFYESDDPTCTPVEKTKGQGFLDAGEHAHIARNESGAPAQTVVTYLVPHGAALRIDQPTPGNCPF